jgi:F-type H+-transporting ATPase subunit b
LPAASSPMVATFSVTSSLLATRAGGGVNLDLDWTILVQIAFILVLWAVLKPMLFDPMLKLFEEREKRIEGAIKKARRIDEESADAKAKYDDAMTKARGEGTAEREKLRSESLRKESELLTVVRAETQKTVDAGRGETQKEVDVTRTNLAPHTRGLAKELAGRVLGREVS